MKKLFLLLTFCATALAGSAQDFGKTLINGSIGFNSNKTEVDYTRSNAYSSSEPKSTSLSISLKIGFFVSSKWAVGASMSYDLNVYKSTTINNDLGKDNYYLNSKSNSFQIGPFVRYYQPLSEKAAFFGQALAAYRHTKTTYDYSEPSATYNDQTIKGLTANLMPGFVFFPSKVIGLELTLGSIGYSRDKSEAEDSNFSTINSSFNALFGLNNLNIGISLYLGRTAGE